MGALMKRGENPHCPRADCGKAGEVSGRGTGGGRKGSSPDHKTIKREYGSSAVGSRRSQSFKLKNAAENKARGTEDRLSDGN